MVERNGLSFCLPLRLGSSVSLDIFPFFPFPFSHPLYTFSTCIPIIVSSHFPFHLSFSSPFHSSSPLFSIPSSLHFLVLTFLLTFIFFLLLPVPFTDSYLTPPTSDTIQDVCVSTKSRDPIFAFKPRPLPLSLPKQTWKLKLCIVTVQHQQHFHVAHTLRTEQDDDRTSHNLTIYLIQVWITKDLNRCRVK